MAYQLNYYMGTKKKLIAPKDKINLTESEESIFILQIVPMNQKVELDGKEYSIAVVERFKNKYMECTPAILKQIQSRFPRSMKPEEKLGKIRGQHIKGVISCQVFPPHLKGEYFFYGFAANDQWNIFLYQIRLNRQETVVLTLDELKSYVETVLQEKYRMLPDLDPDNDEKEKQEIQFDVKNYAKDLHDYARNIQIQTILVISKKEDLVSYFPDEAVIMEKSEYKDYFNQ